MGISKLGPWGEGFKKGAQVMESKSWVRQKSLGLVLGFRVESRRGSDDDNDDDYYYHCRA